LLEHAPETYVALLTTAVYTGLRQSELLGLRWQDVDFESGLLRVRFQLSRAQGGRKAECVALKTGAATRDVELRPAVLRALQDHWAARFELSRAHPEDFVFGTRKGAPLSHDNARTRGIDAAANRRALAASPSMTSGGRTRAT
jgi:integrase